MTKTAWTWKNLYGGGEGAAWDTWIPPIDVILHSFPNFPSFHPNRGIAVQFCFHIESLFWGLWGPVFLQSGTLHTQQGRTRVSIGYDWVWPRTQIQCLRKYCPSQFPLCNVECSPRIIRCIGKCSSGSSDWVGGGRETWNLCGRLRRPSFLWPIFTGPGGQPPLDLLLKCLVCFCC